jgi:hypothetical protein
MTLKFKLATALIVGGTVQIEIPKDQIEITGSTPTCANESGTPIVCGPFTSTTNSGIDYYKLAVMTNWCSGVCAKGATLTIVISNVKNPQWFTSPATSSMIIKTLNGANLADQVTTGVRFDNELTPGKVTITSVTKDNSTSAAMVGNETKFTFVFTPQTDIPSGGKIVITFPENTVSASATLICATGAGSILSCPSSGNANFAAGTLLKVTVTGLCSSGCAGGVEQTIVISKLVNPGSTKPIGTTYSITT